MGYEAKKKVYNLKFEDSDLEGLEVKVRSTSMGNIFKMAELDSVNPQRMTADDIAKIQLVFTVLVKHMISWNLEEDGIPVPNTLEGLMSQEPEFIFTIIKAWSRAMTVVETPLEKPSDDGGQSLEASMKMEMLSQSQAS